MLQPELKLRRDKIRSLMVSQGIDAALITCNANLIYTYGCVVSGYLYLPLHSPALLFFKRPNNITGEHSFSIRKPEQIVDILKEKGLPLPTKLMLEGDELPYTEYVRLAGLFPEAEVVNGTPLIRQARSVKTAIEIEMFRRSGMAHAKAYELIPSVYRPGMTDIEFSIEIERLMRLQGCLGIFRVFGRSMEIFMGSVLTGDNAGYPSPYDFALNCRKRPTPLIRCALTFKKRLLQSPDRVFLAKRFITQLSKWLLRQDLPIDSWERDNRPSSSVTASDWKSMKRLYLLHASSRNWNRAWSLPSNQRLFFRA